MTEKWPTCRSRILECSVLEIGLIDTFRKRLGLYDSDAGLVEDEVAGIAEKFSLEHDLDRRTMPADPRPYAVHVIRQGLGPAHDKAVDREQETGTERLFRFRRVPLAWLA